MLADHQIRSEIELGRVVISPYDASLVQPASVDLRLGFEFIRYTRGDEPIDPVVPDRSQWRSLSHEDLVIRPGDFILGTTLETVGVCSSIAARVEGKSTLGRLGLVVHSTAGFIDPGFRGNVTLELANVNVRPIILRPGMRICQVSFHQMSSAARRPYGTDGLGSHYQGQSGVTPAAILK